MTLQLYKAGSAALMLAALVTGLFPGPVARAQDVPQRSIVHVAGDLYRFQNNAHYSVFLVTPDGVILADPINREVATWIKGEIKKRFDVPVKYVFYSHSHPDHISGGEVFADSATFVAQENAKAKIAAGDYTPVPTETFKTRKIISLGGKRVELIWPGRSHSDNLIVALFPDERALFVVDAISVRRLPYRDFPDAYFPDFIDSLKAIEALDFDILVTGHGPMGVRQDAVDHRLYLEELVGEVRKALAGGLSVEEAQARITLENYRDWAQYDAWRALNVAGLYRILGGQ